MWALLLAILPAPYAPVIDEVARLESNHYFDECGKEIFCQVIGWEESGRVRFWVMAQKGVLRQDVTGRHVFLFDDGFFLREIWSLSYSETHSQFDPETADRELLPAVQRRPLSKARKP